MEQREQDKTRHDVGCRCVKDMGNVVRAILIENKKTNEKHGEMCQQVVRKLVSSVTSNCIQLHRAIGRFCISRLWLTPVE